MLNQEVTGNRKLIFMSGLDARIPSSSYLTEMLALICSAYGAWKTGKPARLAENTSQPD